MGKFLITMIISMLVVVNIKTIQLALFEAYEELSIVFNSVPSELGYKVFTVIAIIIFLYVFFKGITR